MNKVQETTGKVRTFVQEVTDEVKKSTWPEKQELMESTVVVLVSLLLLSLFVGISDKILVEVFRLIT